MISQDDLLRYSEPSLFIFGNIYFSYGYFKDPYSFTQIPGSIQDIGFASNWLQPLSNVPARTRDFLPGSFCIDRFITFERGDCRNALARIEVKEKHVRDDYVRSDIDYTGFEVCVTLREDAFRLFQDHLTSIEPERSETFRDSRRLAVRIPVRPFVFPLPRGNVDPWNTLQNVVGKLRPIKRFRADNIAVTMMSREPFTSPAADGSLHDRYAPWLRTTISIHYR
jgi:hypothetical protein